MANAQIALLIGTAARLSPLVLKEWVGPPLGLCGWGYASQRHLARGLLAGGAAAIGPICVFKESNDDRTARETWRIAQRRYRRYGRSKRYWDIHKS